MRAQLSAMETGITARDPSSGPAAMKSDVRDPRQSLCRSAFQLSKRSKGGTPWFWQGLALHCANGTRSDGCTLQLSPSSSHVNGRPLVTLFQVVTSNIQVGTQIALSSDR